MVREREGIAVLKLSVPERVRNVRSRYDLRDYISQELGIDRRNARGRYVQVPCPFHADSNPSMAIYEANYFCHGCREHGDIIDWVRHRTGVEFFIALEMLEGVRQDAPSYHAVTPMPQVETWVGKDALRTALYKTIHAAEAKMLGSPASRYCELRGWDKVVQQAYSLGYLDVHSSDLESLGGREAFEEMGLLYESGHPWFARRLIIPLFDVSGSPVALATRTFSPQENEGPRYINSRRSALFRRDETVYGAHLIPDDTKYLLIVEGYADVWSLYRIGIPAVAIMSDRMTDFHYAWTVMTARERGCRIVLAFDGDDAGQQGEQVSYARLAMEDIPVSRLSLRDGLDVSEIIERQGWQAMKGLLSHIERSC